MQFFMFLVPLLCHAGVLFFIALIYYLAIEPKLLTWLAETSYVFLSQPWGQYYFVAFAVLLLLLELEYFLLRVRQSKRTRFIILERLNGRVSLSVAALEDFIIKISKGFPEVKSLKPQVSSMGKTLKIALNIILWSGYNISHFTDALKKNLKSQIQNILGLEREVQIIIHIKELQEDKKEVFQDRMFRGIET